MERLISAIRTTPLIDNRARPLLIPSSKTKHSLLSITTEANGNALKAARSTLAHIQATNQLADILGCPPTWNDVLKAIAKENEKPGYVWIKQCLEGIETIILDDCLSMENKAFDYSWHDNLTRSKCRRIVRIEDFAADIVDRNINLFAISEDRFFNSVVEDLQKGINDALSDTDVVGFISAICYRTRLDIPWVCPLELVKLTLMQCIWKQQAEGHSRFKGFDCQILNSWIVHITAGLIQQSKNPHKKPIQFHTSLGDDEIPLTRSLPSHLEDFIREYSDVPIVLVHSCYPWTKEAGYLATVHSNVYVDIGEVFPCVSQDGKEGVIRDLLELCPTEKIVWSSDGHDLPETYLLAQIQSREAFEKVLVEYVNKKALTIQQAVEVVENIFFNTSNQLYALQSKLRPTEIQAGDRSLDGLDGTTMVNGVNVTKDVYHTKGISTINKINGVNGRNGISGANGSSGTKSTSHADVSKNSSDLELFESFMAQHPEIKFLRVQYVDYCSITRLRILPIKRVRNLLCDEKVDVSIGITNSSLTLTPVDHRIDSVSPRGVSRLLTAVPSSMRSGPCHGYASAQGELRNSDNSPLDVCPRTNLRNIVNRAKNYGLEFLVGYEIEVIFMKGTLNEDNTQVYTPLPGADSHCWGSNNALSPAVINLMDEIVEKLSDAGIDLEQWHPESATGQFEFVLPACAPLEAADILLQTREIITAVAQTHGWRATLHPKPLPYKMGTGAHVHLSIPTPEGEKEQTYTHFYAGILKHLRAITAFTYGNPASYDRMLAAGGWAGSTWVTWGTQNRETALRKIEGSHWELRCMDGLANVYLALAAIIGAGVEGVVSKDKMTWLDCDMNPAKLSQADRDVYNIEDMLPCTLEEALAALKNDQGMYKILGEAVVVTYIAMKQGELELMNSMKDEQRRNWLIERY
ncbi:putative glutamine synthetase protein [Botrytis fragariae]|uniref:Putative glutamine synthetase protein n=1 Tax=Botrytis fragariae TaxID=1964551 RepID=A0A8H6AIR2_9HELO|nr:putative glutamine synthetase protein [Botrytis fragariae]KAF5868224.1 putative glutamine synthetase protein [Botrytis fragariae]